MSINTIEIPIYGVTLSVVTTLEEYDSLDITTDDLNDHRGRLDPIIDNSGAVHYYIGVFDNEKNTLIHELGHLCLMIVERAGFNAHDGNGEPFCYLFDWVYKQTASWVDSNS